MHGETVEFTAYHITMYFHWSIPQYCSLSKAQHTLPEDGLIGSKHVAANKEIFLTVRFKVLYV